MRLMVTVGFALVLCTLAPLARADQDPLANEVKEACKAELDTYCKQVTPGEGRLLACLYAFEDKLSARCDYGLYDASVRLERAVAALSYGAAECKDDIAKHCASVQAGEGRIVECLKKQGDKLSKRCSQAMKDLGL
ncbi:MAG TPA: cysteine rich repeat-containing protein [Candidatus Eisenbacteria bacterium]|nr:cysteine rich repeat-containing protein [Candidatus Eisenbacteria bacterium]